MKRMGNVKLLLVALLPFLAGCRPDSGSDAALGALPPNGEEMVAESLESAADSYTRILTTAFLGGREPRGEYALCGVASHLFIALAHEPGAKPSAELLLGSPWIPFRPRPPSREWQALPSVESSRTGLRAEALAETVTGEGQVRTVWLTDPEEGATGIQGATVCRQSAGSALPAFHRIMNGDRRPSEGHLQWHLGVWTAAVVTWAYDTTGYLPETVAGWSDVVVFAGPTPETAAWVQQAREAFNEALALAHSLMQTGAATRPT